MKVIASNKKARFNYNLEKTFEVGLVLKGSEIKSIRLGHISLDESFVKIRTDMQLYIHNMYIKHYEYAHSVEKYDERMARRLLMHKKEIKKLNQEVKEQGYTLVPTKMYFKGNIVKLEIALAKGKKNYDKRQTLKERDIKRDIDKQIKANY